MRERSIQRKEAVETFAPDVKAEREATEASEDLNDGAENPADEGG